MTLNFNTHISSYIELDVVLQVPFRSLAAIVSKNPLLSLFSIEKHKLPNFTLL